MANLITKHDPYHIHKILGVLVLINYVYRFFLVFRHGTAFPTLAANEGSQWYSVASVLLHGALSWSSLLLPLPSVRNFNSPMIWPEFRLHSIAFASRHVITTVISLCDAWPSNLGRHALARMILVVGTNHVAFLITEKYGDRTKRTTNAMPYPSSVTEEQQFQIKAAYTRAQFSATKACQLPDATMNFGPLLAIQVAPLLMTLVRKGKITSFTYHRVYAASLFAGYIMVFVRMIVDPQLAMISVAVMSLPTSNIRKYTTPLILGVVQVLFSIVLCPLLVNPFMDAFVNKDDQDLISNLALIAAIVTSIRQLEYYSPLFGSDNDDKNRMNATGISFTKGVGNLAEFILPAMVVVYTIICKLTTSTATDKSVTSIMEEAWSLWPFSITTVESL